MDEELGNTPEIGSAVPGQIEIVEIAGGSAKKRVVVDTSSSSSDSSSSSGADKRKQKNKVFHLSYPLQR